MRVATISPIASPGSLSGSCTTSTDHAILLVGYGYRRRVSLPGKVKNSWGTDWGCDGYLILQRVSGSGPGTCGIQTHTCGAVVYGPYNPSSQIRGEDGEFIADVAKSRAHEPSRWGPWWCQEVPLGFGRKVVEVW